MNIQMQQFSGIIKLLVLINLSIGLINGYSPLCEGIDPLSLLNILLTGNQ